MDHRRDIDGLRAVAVLPVILFHAGLPLLPGGWLGVDVFFVISGYLITALLIEAHRTGGISLLAFYERRARRILPALFVMLLFTTLMALVWLPPRELAEYGASLGLTGAFLSNLWFMTRTGYFANSSELYPLLHTWSLAVEEQFYLVFPVLLAALLRWRLPVLPVLSILLTLSFGFAVWAIGPYPEQVFFFPLARAWELLIGAVLVSPSGRQEQKSIHGDVGLLLIVAAMVFTSGSGPALFPGVGPVAVAIGTGLILRFGAGRYGRRFLTLRPVVGMGLISYSAYLWHQPLFALAAARQLEPFDPLVQLALQLGIATLSIAIAVVSWVFVEEPVRRHNVSWFAGRARVLWISAIGSLVIFLVGLGIYVADGLPSRVTPEVAGVSSAKIYNPWRGRCDANRAGKVPQHPVPACSLEGSAPLVYLYGDSHAAMIWGSLRDELLAAGHAGYVATQGGCPALPGLAVIGDPRAVSCDSFARASMADMIARPEDSILVVALRWPFYVEGARFDNGIGGVETGENNATVPLATLAEAFDEGVRRARVLGLMKSALVDLARSHRVVLIYPVPEAGWDVPAHLAKMGMFGVFPQRLSLPQELAVRRASEVEEMLDSLNGQNVLRVRPRDIFCDGQTCALNDGSVSFYADNNHLSAEGSALVARAVMLAINGQ